MDYLLDLRDYHHYYNWKYYHSYRNLFYHPVSIYHQPAVILIRSIASISNLVANNIADHFGIYDARVYQYIQNTWLQTS